MTLNHHITLDRLTEVATVNPMRHWVVALATWRGNVETSDPDPAAGR